MRLLRTKVGGERDLCYPNVIDLFIIWSFRMRQLLPLLFMGLFFVVTSSVSAQTPPAPSLVLNDQTAVITFAGGDLNSGCSYFLRGARFFKRLQSEGATTELTISQLTAGGVEVSAMPRSVRTKKNSRKSVKGYLAVEQQCGDEMLLSDAYKFLLPARTTGKTMRGWLRRLSNRM